MDDPHLSAYHLSPGIVNRDIAIRILTYLTFDSFDHLEIQMWDGYKIHFDENVRQSLSKFIGESKIGIFFPYAAGNWAFHFSHDKDTGSHDLYALLQRFFKNRYGQLGENIGALRWTCIKADIENAHLYALLVFAINNSVIWAMKRILNDYPEIGHINPSETITPLIGAIGQGRTDVIKILLEAGADPQETDIYGRTAIHYAASDGSLEILTMLIQAGVDPKTADQGGTTALHRAASGGCLDVLKVLIQAGVDPSCKDKSGNTPLHIAINLHSQPMVELLLLNGASLETLGPLYDEQAEWAKDTPWYPQLMLKSFDYSSPSGERVDRVSAHAVLEVRWMFHHILQLPSEITGRILELSEYWSHSFTLRKDYVEVGSGDLFSPFRNFDGQDHDVAYLSVKLDSIAPTSLRKIVFTTKSREVFPRGSLGMQEVFLHQAILIFCFRSKSSIPSYELEI